MDPDVFKACISPWADNLDPDGVFIFHFNTEYKYRASAWRSDDRGEPGTTCSLIWDNYYYEEERINEYELSPVDPRGRNKRPGRI